MPEILDHPDAQALLDQATVAPADVAACTRHLTAFLRRYLPLCYRDEQRERPLNSWIKAGAHITDGSGSPVWNATSPRVNQRPHFITS